MTGLRRKTAIVTTSWDDGHPLDLKLAQLLKSYGVFGTFYIPQTNGEMPVVTGEQIRSLRQMGMEVGAHTRNHIELPGYDKETIIRELNDNKKYLVDIIGEDVVSFCYPRGKFDSESRSLVKAAGFKLARTTVAFRMDREFDPLCMPTTLQFYPHRRPTAIRHGLKEMNWRGLFDWCRLFHLEADFSRLIPAMLDRVLYHGGILHIWGHSWEIEKMGLWEQLESMLDHISRKPGVLYLTNAQVLEHLGI